MVNIDDLLFVIVLYKNNLQSSASYVTLCEWFSANNVCGNILVYDNSPDSIEKIMDNHHVVNYIHDSSNPGVSKAYNVSAQFGYKRGKKWLVLLDNDTKISKDYLPQLMEAINNNYNVKLFAPMLRTNGFFVSPSAYYCKKGFPKKKVNSGLQLIKHINFLNSGLCINIEAFLEVGGYDERIQLYFSDYEFVDRFKKKHPQVYVLKTIMEHELSDMVFWTFENASRTFVYYCRGAKIAINSLSSWFCYTFIVISRALKLSFRYRRIIFFRILLTDFVLFRKKNE